MSKKSYRTFLITTLQALDQIGTLTREGTCTECGHGDGIALLKESVMSLLLTIGSDIAERGVHYDNRKAKGKFQSALPAPAPEFLDRYLDGGDDRKRLTGRQGPDGDP